MERTPYVILFRGVGGATQLPVARLRASLAEAGFENVATYINSGNAVLVSRKSPEAVRKAVASTVVAQFGFTKDLFAIPQAEWAAILDANPLRAAEKEPAKLHVFYLGADPEPERVEAIRARATGGDRVELRKRALYVHTPDGFSSSRLAPRISTLVGVPNTARNWNTSVRLGEMAKAALA